MSETTREYLERVGALLREGKVPDDYFDVSGLYQLALGNPNLDSNGLPDVALKPLGYINDQAVEDLRNGLLSDVLIRPEPGGYLNCEVPIYVCPSPDSEPENQS